MRSQEDQALLTERWASKYGSVFRFPGLWGEQWLILCEGSKGCDTFLQQRRLWLGAQFGRNLLWVEGEHHQRQRKFLTPAFSNAAIRDLTHVFYDSAHKTSSAWDAILEVGDGTSTIDVQNWMDSIGIAGFSHDFGAIDGKPQMFDELDLSKGAAFFALMMLMSAKFPTILRLPSKKKDALAAMNGVFSDIADRLLAKAKVHGNDEDKSVMGLLLKSETHGADVHMSREEIIAQNLFLLAGYETTSIVHETLRMHPPVFESVRVAMEDDVLPLATPVVTISGGTVNSLFIEKGTIFTVPIRTLNRSEEFWGADAKEFKPERWLEDIAPRAKEIQGHRHLLRVKRV
ncbi:cytochrome P450 [Armillaria novae-zelandiae]|uniref:Cytochrome P450 n=1 Tax=Armillaria novae-zelandiae TaxID=153914 RepID=A0AA39PW69_9AGAR|nr:cytochrome P450 [Armillaria novae-zelandiae]